VTFTLLICLAILKRSFELLILVMRLRKYRWRGKLIVKKVFGGRENLLLKEKGTVSTNLDIAINMDLDARKMWKEQNRTFWLLLSLDMKMICLGRLLDN
jgi:hypothetical protein